MLSKISRYGSCIIVGLGPLGSIAITAISVLSVAEIFRRYVLNAPSIWSAELIVMLAALTYAFAGPFAQFYQRHIAITVLSERFPPRLAKFSAFLKLATGILYLSALIYGSGQMAYSALNGNERSGTAWDTPIPQIVKLALVVALGMFLLLLLRDLWRVVRAIFTGATLPVAPHFTNDNGNDHG
ncbi:TRAP transporter small permease [Celeribacter halophilus]|jgi:TRAP-type C4-dicarboxylate transport system permease small subunit|uniref:TRAP transporter small permease subunit n=1 Tax=Celeribacter halophilus TaxID=576117 RepID=UPI0026E142F9|nr:TRAP transporter small permease [Celeribacter halophilus]MDO6725108.1 TRAP transporter small permease [Celeribacter halophilus]